MIRSLIARPRLAVSIVAGLLLFFVLPHEWNGFTKALVSWDICTAGYIAAVAIMMYRSDELCIRKRAAVQDDGGLAILGITVTGALASLAAIMHELAKAKSMEGAAVLQSIALAAVTVFLSWIFMQTMFALHYAHEYYRADKGADGGLEFPKKYVTPDYWDFVYFSFIIGTAAQTADINITSKFIRRIVTLHCVIVFFFNTTILALAINVGAGLL